MNHKISKYYDKKQAEDYEPRRNNHIWQSEIDVFKKIKLGMAKKFNHSLKVLDIGAGTGRWINDLHDITAKYVVTDVSQNMLDQAKLKLKNCPEKFNKRVQFINSSVQQLPLFLDDKFDLIIMTRFLSHFSVNEIKNILNIVSKYSKGDVVVSLRVADKGTDILLEIFDLIFKSPIGAIKRFAKSGRLTYTRLESEYDKVISETGFRVIRKNLVLKDKFNRYEYWEFTSN